MPTSDEEAQRSSSEELKRQYTEKLDAFEAELDSTLNSLANLQQEAVSKDIPGLQKSMDKVQNLQGKVTSLISKVKEVEPYKLTYEPYRSEISSRYHQIFQQITEIGEELKKEMLKEVERIDVLQEQRQKNFLRIQDEEAERERNRKAEEEEEKKRTEMQRKKNEHDQGELRAKKNAIREEASANLTELRELMDKVRKNELMQTQATDNIALHAELEAVLTKIDSILGDGLLTEVEKNLQNNKYDNLLQKAPLRRILKDVKEKYLLNKKYCMELLSTIEKLQDLEPTTKQSFSSYREASSNNDLTKLREEIKAESERLKEKEASLQVALKDLENLRGIAKKQCDVIERYGEQIKDKISIFVRMQSDLEGYTKIEKNLKENLKDLLEKKDTFFHDEKEEMTKEVEKLKNQTELKEEKTYASDYYLETKWLFDLQVTSLKKECEEIERKLQSVKIKVRRSSQFTISFERSIFLEKKYSEPIIEKIKTKYPNLEKLKEAVIEHKKKNEIIDFLKESGLTETQAKDYLWEVTKRERETYISELEEINKILKEVTEESKSIKEGQEKLRQRLENSVTSTPEISSMPSSSNLEEIKEMLLKLTNNDEKDKESNDKNWKSMQTQIESILQQGALLVKGAEDNRLNNEIIKDLIFNQIKGVYTLPKFVTIIPAEEIRDPDKKVSHLFHKAVTVKEWGKEKYKLFFHCSRCMKPAQCGEKGHGYNIFDSKSLKTIMPLARVSAVLLKVALTIGGVPNVKFGDNIVECDYIDQVSQTLIEDDNLMEGLEEGIADSIKDAIRNIEQEQKFPDHLTAKMKPITNKCHKTIENLLSKVDPGHEMIGLDLVKGGEDLDTSIEWVCSTCTEGFKAEGKEYEVVDVPSIFKTDAISSPSPVSGA